MLESALPYLVCPATGSALRIEVTARQGNRILEGMLVSVQDDTRRYPIRQGVPRFVDFEDMAAEQRETIDTFSYKWTRIPHYSYDAASKAYREGWYYERFNFPQGDADVREFLRGARFILEAGTGTGVDTDMLMRNSDALIFGVDISRAIDIAHERFQQNDRIVLLQADIGHLPFAPDFFDVISCDQVLHHTPNPPENFGKLVHLLQPAGHLLLYVYKVKGALREFSDDYLRGKYTDSPLEEALDFSERITRLGHNLSKLNIKVEVEDDFPEFGFTKGTYDVQRLIYDYIFKCYWNDSFDFETNVMVNFDWYRPTHAFRYTPAQIQAWCQTHHLAMQHLHVSPSGISSIMRKQA